MTDNKFTRSGIRAIMTAAGIETDKAQKITAQIIKGIAAALIAGKTVEIRGLGTLESRERKARTRRNPKTGEPVHVPAQRVIFFKSSGALKTALNTEGM